MSHKANDPYNEAGIDILKHGPEKSHAMLKKKHMAKKMSWAESHGQKEGSQLKGTITGRKFGPKSY